MTKYSSEKSVIVEALALIETETPPAVVLAIVDASDDLILHIVAAACTNTRWNFKYSGDRTPLTLMGANGKFYDIARFDVSLPQHYNITYLGEYNRQVIASMHRKGFRRQIKSKLRTYHRTSPSRRDHSALVLDILEWIGEIIRTIEVENGQQLSI